MFDAPIEPREALISGQFFVARPLQTLARFKAPIAVGVLHHQTDIEGIARGVVGFGAFKIISLFQITLRAIAANFARALEIGFGAKSLAQRDP